MAGWFDSSWGFNTWFPSSWGFSGATPGFGTKPKGIQAFTIIERGFIEIQDIDSLDTSTISSPAGDFRIPIDANRSFAKIMSVVIQTDSGGSGFTYDIVDKNVVNGPRIRTYIDGILQDVVISGVIRGFKGS